ncbi:hypothetical protein DFH11DRAFT_387819 [Phellopilus nigrolimitatus]|nr:hypothetical protein DFH11DRAFT_387819 [Phellopilus nigrolimitatus]
MATSHPSDHSADYPRLILSNTSLRNNVLDCDALSLHYRLSTPTDGTSKLQHVTQISRWDAHHGNGEAEFVPVNDVLRKTTFTVWDVNRTFKANNGKHYTWKADPYSMKLYCEDNSKQEVASYHQRRIIFSPQKAYIELFHGYEDILDYLVVTCAIVERIRRETDAQSGSMG